MSLKGCGRSSPAAVRPVQEVVAVAKSSFGILVDRNHDGLDVLVALALERTHAPHIGQRFNPGRVVRIEHIIGLEPMGKGLMGNLIRYPTKCATRRNTSTKSRTLK
jgi:hypothetical protein